MSRQVSSLAIVFAQIRGASRLYATLSEDAARTLASLCLDLLSRQVSQHHGTVIKTIGDELMCTFTSADRAVEAAIGMQEAIVYDLPERHPEAPPSLMVRVGLHFGPAILENGDVFGDAVNVAARMAEVAKGGQIITTRETAAGLAAALRSGARHLDRIAVKGKSEEIDIFEIVWQSEEVTRMATVLGGASAKRVTLRLSHNGRQHHLDQSTEPIILGRGKKADVVINDSMASREHARIECRRGKFILTDVSTNGTYVQTADGPSYLRREELVLSGEGRIAFGRDLGEATELVSFRCD